MVVAAKIEKFLDQARRFWRLGLGCLGLARVEDELWWILLRRLFRWRCRLHWRSWIALNWWLCCYRELPSKRHLLRGRLRPHLWLSLGHRGANHRSHGRRLGNHPGRLGNHLRCAGHSWRCLLRHQMHIQKSLVINRMHGWVKVARRG